MKSETDYDDWDMDFKQFHAENQENAIQKSHRLNRIAGVLVGQACGDALGAAYEFGGPIPKDQPIGMIGGGPFNFAPGEYTDDTQMAFPIAASAAAGDYLLDDKVVQHVFGQWQEWARTANDVGTQTRQVLSRADETEASARKVSRELHERSGRSGGNGALMRTSPVALAFLEEDEDSADDLTLAARRYAELTHWEDHAGDACVLWTHAIRHAINDGELEVLPFVELLPQERREYWTDKITEAELNQPEYFHRTNGWVVSAFQGAWSALYHTYTFTDAIEAAVRGGGDTDTVAAIAGGLAGAYYGVSSVPAEYRRVLHGWPGLKFRDLVNLAILSSQYGDTVGTHNWPTGERFIPGFERTAVKHPHDDGVWIGSLAAVDMLPDIDAVVSMSRVGTVQHQTAETVEFWVVDYPGENLNLEFALKDAVDTIAKLRAEDKTVLLHCYAAHSRTPSTAALYSALHCGVPIDKAIKDVVASLPDARPQKFLVDAIHNIAKKAGK
jgi:ADP-ribosyl-[dinitrogen reductase] hydrolase